MKRSDIPVTRVNIRFVPDIRRPVSDIRYFTLILYLVKRLRIKDCSFKVCSFASFVQQFNWISGTTRVNIQDQEMFFINTKSQNTK